MTEGNPFAPGNLRATYRSAMYADEVVPGMRVIVIDGLTDTLELEGVVTFRSATGVVIKAADRYRPYTFKSLGMAIHTPVNEGFKHVTFPSTRPLRRKYKKKK